MKIGLIVFEKSQRAPRTNEQRNQPTNTREWKCRNIQQTCGQKSSNEQRQLFNTTQHVEWRREVQWGKLKQWTIRTM